MLFQTEDKCRSTGSINEIHLHFKTRNNKDVNEQSHIEVSGNKNAKRILEQSYMYQTTFLNM